MACRCGTPVMLGFGTLDQAILGALNHLRTCRLHTNRPGVEIASIEVLTTLRWSRPAHYQKYKAFLDQVWNEAVRISGEPVRQTGCRACG
jgi:hypothetical protein